MRLRGTEKSFFIAPLLCCLSKKRPNGKYKYETDGTLILTTRRLTFCTYSKRGAALNRGDSLDGYRQALVGFDPSRGKKQDWIIFSYPSFRLCKNKIKNSLDEKLIKEAKNEEILLLKNLLEDEGIKFVFWVE